MLCGLSLWADRWHFTRWGGKGETKYFFDALSLSPLSTCTPTLTHCTTWLLGIECGLQFIPWKYFDVGAPSTPSTSWYTAIIIIQSMLHLSLYKVHWLSNPFLQTRSTSNYCVYPEAEWNRFSRRLLHPFAQRNTL
jgi:hypothetical protein